MAPFTDVYSVCFAGNGGTGIRSKGSMFVAGCTFTGNGVGLQFDVSHSTSIAPTYRHNVFSENEIGILISDMYGTVELVFPECTFSQNDADIQNDAEHPIDISGAAFE